MIISRTYKTWYRDFGHYTRVIQEERRGTWMHEGTYASSSSTSSTSSFSSSSSSSSSVEYSSDSSSSLSSSSSSIDSSSENFIYLASGSLTPDITGGYYYGGTYNGKDYFINGTYFIFHYNLDYYSISDSLGGVAMWVGENQNIESTYSPNGGNTGTATVSAY